jgi:hypothetical protein
MILVFCTPTFPAIVRKHAMLKRIASYLISWVSIISVRSASLRTIFESRPKEPGNELLTLNASDMPRSESQPAASSQTDL